MLEGAAASAPSAAGSRCSDLKASLLSQCRQPRTEQPDLSTAAAAPRRCQRQLERPLRAGQRPTPSRVDYHTGMLARPAPCSSAPRPARRRRAHHRGRPMDHPTRQHVSAQCTPLYLLGMEEDGTYISSGICVRKLAVKSEIPAFTVPRDGLKVCDKLGGQLQPRAPGPVRSSSGRTHRRVRAQAGPKGAERLRIRVQWSVWIERAVHLLQRSAVAAVERTTEDCAEAWKHLPAD